MDFRLRIFLAVARAGQLTQASRQLNLSASSVSEQLASLEHELGSALFWRTNRGMKLTLSGEQLLRAALRMEGQWNAVVRDLAGMAKGLRPVRIAASQTAVELYLPTPLGRFRRDWPDVPLQVLMVNSQAVVDMVASGNVDVGLVEGGGIPSTLVSTPLWQDQLALMVSHDHVLAERESVDLEDLRELDWILREKGSGTRAIFEQALAVSGFPPKELNVIMELASLRAILAMVANNVGVSVLSTAIVESDPITVHGIASLTIDQTNLRRSLNLVTLREGSREPLVDNLVERLVKDAARHHRRRSRPGRLDPIGSDPKT